MICLFCVVGAEIVDRDDYEGGIDGRKEAGLGNKVSRELRPLKTALARFRRLQR